MQNVRDHLVFTATTNHLSAARRAVQAETPLLPSTRDNYLVHSVRVSSEAFFSVVKRETVLANEFIIS